MPTNKIPCVELLVRFAKSNGLAPFPDLSGEGNTFRLPIKNPSGTNWKNVRLFPGETWGEAPQAIGKTFTVAIPVEDIEEARAIVRTIIDSSDVLARASKEKGLERGLEIPGVLWGYCERPQDSGAGSEVFELAIRLPNNADKSRNAALLADALLKAGLESIPQGQRWPMDMATQSGRREWAYYSFLDWSHHLTHEEQKALRDFGGPDFRAINGFVRKPVENHGNSEKLKQQVKHLDAAIAKGNIGESITLYRAESKPELVQAWENLAKGTPPPNINPDPGFIIATLESATAHWWNTSELKGKGIVLEMSIPAGTHAGYLDARGVLTNRGYQELVFARGSRLKPERAYLDPKGRRVLKVTLSPGA